MVAFLQFLVCPAAIFAWFMWYCHCPPSAPILPFAKWGQKEGNDNTWTMQKPGGHKEEKKRAKFTNCNFISKIKMNPISEIWKWMIKKNIWKSFFHFRSNSSHWLELMSLIEIYTANLTGKVNVHYKASKIWCTNLIHSIVSTFNNYFPFFNPLPPMHCQLIVITHHSSSIIHNQSSINDQWTSIGHHSGIITFHSSTITNCYIIIRH